MRSSVFIGRSHDRLSTNEEKGKMRGMTKHFVHLRYLIKADTSADNMLRSPTVTWSTGYFEKKLACKPREAFLFKNVTSESISQNRTILPNCQIKTFCVVFYWSLTFNYWARHISSWTIEPSNRTRWKTGNLTLKCAEILSNFSNEIKR